MKVYEIQIELKSPTTVTRARTERNFLSFTDHIPASTLRGSLLSSLYWHGLLTKDRLKEEASAPRLIASPAYPMAGKVRFYPCHPFVVECKMCRAQGKPSIFSYLNDALPKILNGEFDKAFRTRCENGHMALRSLHPGIHGSLDGGLSTGRTLAGVHTAVGVSKHRGSSMKGMLYGYEALIAGQRFWATLATSDSIELSRGIEIWLGRGKSRGFGESELISVKEVSLENKLDEIASLIKPGEIALYSISPLLQCVKEENLPFPSEIGINDLAKSGGLRKPDVRLNVISVLGKSFTLWTGWDMAKNQSKPVLNASEPGSIAIARLQYRNVNEAAHVLLLLEYFGTIENALGFPLTGLNMLAVLEAHPAAMLGE